MRHRIGKKIALMIGTAVLLTSVAGCGSAQQTAETGSSTAGNSQTGNSTARISETRMSTAGSSEVGIRETENSGEENIVTIGYLPITHALPLFETKELLEREGAPLRIELQKFGSWTDLTDALNAGEIDGASMLVELAMSATSQGIGLKAVGLGHRDGNVVVVSNDIETAEDLKGKTFAIPSNLSSHNILLGDMLEAAGLDKQDVTIVQLAPAEMPSSLASGAIAGYLVAEPFGAQAVVNGIGHVLYESEELWEDSICCALVLREDFIDAQKEQADKLISYYYDAGNSLSGERALEVAKEYLGQDEEVLKASLEWISYENLAISEEDYALLAEKVKEDEILAEPPVYEEFVYRAQNAE